MSHLLQLWIHWSRINPMIPNPYEVPFGAIVLLGVFGYVRRLRPRLSRALDARADAIDLASRIVGEPLQSASSGQ